MIDERMLRILQEVAQEHTEEDSMGDLSCCFCSGDRDYENQVDDIAHHADCPTVIARTVLSEQRKPLQAYCVEFDYSPYGMTTLPRNHAKQYRTAYAESELRELFLEGEQHNRYNVQITYVKDL